jgi:hypothetical protein
LRKDWTGGDGQRNEEGSACQAGNRFHGVPVRRVAEKASGMVA